MIYVGKAKNLKKRVSSYFSKDSFDPRITSLIEEVCSINHIVVDSEVEAFLLEANLIKKNKPYYNIRLSDDKFFPYVKVGKYPYPYVSITRKLNENSARYFGPYTSAADLKVVLKLLRRIFPYQSAKFHHKKRCLYYHLGLCPCIPANPENLSHYKRNINRLLQFLQGKKDAVVKSLKKEQKENVKNEEFEKAQKIQGRIDKIDLITTEHYDPFLYQQKPNLYYQRIENELASLQSILKKYGVSFSSLKRIECYDISNIQGKQATGSMVVFIEGEASRSNYKRFKIKFKTSPDDFAMIKEVVGRRFKHLDWGVPDLLIIDGGKGQVGAALAAFSGEDCKIAIIGLAKRRETIIIPIKAGARLDFLEIALPISTPGVNLLRRIRDEAHRFAINYHRLLRRKSLNI